MFISTNLTRILKFQIESIPSPKCKFEAEQKNQMKVFLTSATASAFGPNHVVYILDFVHSMMNIMEKIESNYFLTLILHDLLLNKIYHYVYYRD